MSSDHPVLALLVGLGALVNVAPVTSLATGGVHNDVPEQPTYPLVRVWARARPIGPMGGDSVWEADVEFWVLSRYGGDKEALAIATALTARFANGQQLTVTGWRVIEFELQDLYPAGDEEIGGVKVKQWVLPFRGQLERA
jgi:hypothetical protein